VTEKTTEQPSERVRALIISGDNRLKQGGRVQARKARETYEKALAELEAAGIADDLVRTLLERRIEDVRELENAENISE
jgi:hypothetical protein